MAQDESVLDAEQVAAAIRSKLADCRKALEWVEDPRYAPIEAYYRGVLSDYEQTLHNVNVDAMVRDRACYVVDALTKVIRLPEYYRQKVKQLEAQLKELEGRQAPTMASRMRDLFLFSR